MTATRPAVRAVTARWRAAAEPDGYTLVEVAVAMTLLVVVLVPTALVVVSLTASPVVRHRAEGLALARADLEETLARPPGEAASGDETDGPWRVVRTVERDGHVVRVRVEAYRLGRGPLAALEGARLDPPAPDPFPPGVP